MNITAVLWYIRTIASDDTEPFGLRLSINFGRDFDDLVPQGAVDAQL